MQQSAAFKILRTRLKTVPSYSFSGEQLQNTSLGTSHIRGPNHIPVQDGEVKQDKQGINFALRLQQFEKMQRQHRARAKSQAKSQNTSASKVISNCYLLCAPDLCFHSYAVFFDFNLLLECAVMKSEEI